MQNYEQLGIRRFINACGPATVVGGSLMPAEVLDAMQEGARSFVNLNALNLKAGEYMARRIGVEAATISCGAASGMQLAAAAYLTGTDQDRITQLPHTEGWKNEFVISTVDTHIFVHQGIEACGGKLVRAGDTQSVTTEDILDSLSDNTAAVVHFLGKQGKDQLREVIEGCESQGVPVIVDAANELPPRSNLTEIAGMGASLVVFSGGKGIRGPQNSGLVLGEKEMVEAVRLNASPRTAIGRGMKVGKEEIMGIVTAVDLFLKGSDEEDHTTWEWQASCIVDALKGVPDLRAYVLREGQEMTPDDIPRAYVDMDERRAEEAVRLMLEGEPSVYLRQSIKGIVVDPTGLVPGEEEVVAERLRVILLG